MPSVWRREPVAREARVGAHGGAVGLRAPDEVERKRALWDERDPHHPVREVDRDRDADVVRIQRGLGRIDLRRLGDARFDSGPVEQRADGAVEPRGRSGGAAEQHDRLVPQVLERHLGASRERVALVVQTETVSSITCV